LNHRRVGKKIGRIKRPEGLQALLKLLIFILYRRESSRVRMWGFRCNDFVFEESSTVVSPAVKGRIDLRKEET
jgi:hypothetical protein